MPGSPQEDRTIKIIKKLGGVISRIGITLEYKERGMNVNHPTSVCQNIVDGQCSLPSTTEK